MLNWLKQKFETTAHDDERSDRLKPLVDAFLEEARARDCWELKLKELDTGKTLLELEPDDHVAILHLLLRRYIGVFERCRRPGGGSSYTASDGGGIRVLQTLMSQLLRRKLPYTDNDLAELLKTANDNWKLLGWKRPHKAIFSAIERHYAHQELPPRIVPHIRKTGRLTHRVFHEYAEERELRKRVDILLGKKSPTSLSADCMWSRTLLQELAALPEDRQAAWDLLIQHAVQASASKPSKKWLSVAGELLDGVSHDEFVKLFSAMLGNIQAEKITDLPLKDENNNNLVKGFIWAASLLPPERVARDIKFQAIYCFRKIPNLGAVSTRTGNACVHVLGQLPGLESVAMLNELNQKVKYPSARKLVGKALDQAAARNGMSRLDLEEISVPDYGLDENAELRQDLDDCTAMVKLVSKDVVQLLWQKDDGAKIQKTVPAAIRQSHADEVRQLKRLVKDIQSTMQSQVLRLESMYLQDRSWSLTDWQARLIEHPLLRIAARKLIWQFKIGEQQWSGIWADKHIVDVKGQAISADLDGASVQLWHPIFSEADEVLAWRKHLIENEITQPFKQAHREVYVLTDAERETDQYSNRFAAHVLKQHQFNALCQQRGWRYNLQGNFDAWNAPTIELPHLNLSVEFWVDGIEGSEYDSGIFACVTSDQVRFVRDGDCLPLVSIDPLVFSEVMRNVDLFVGVCSIGNDPEWNDQGVRGFGHYWQEYSFGELNASAKTRKEVLEFLLPKLKISDRYQIEDRYLVVHGKLRSYKIHLGSGNILMEPNNQYLCIVEGRSGKSSTNKLFLPFEGDHRMAVILSKAFLLAEDDKIKDRTIVNQIGPKQN